MTSRGLGGSSQNGVADSILRRKMESTSRFFQYFPRTTIDRASPLPRNVITAPPGPPFAVQAKKGCRVSGGPDDTPAPDPDYSTTSTRSLTRNVGVVSTSQ